MLQKRVIDLIRGITYDMTYTSVMGGFRLPRDLASLLLTSIYLLS